MLHHATDRTPATTTQDAIALLEDDHRHVAELFAMYDESNSEPERAYFARQICDALTIHMLIEEELLYPKLLASTAEETLHHRALVEHDGAKQLIDQLFEGGPEHPLFDARVQVLQEMIRHHVEEEEKPDGMFAKLRASGIDLVSLGADLAARKRELLGS